MTNIGAAIAAIVSTDEDDEAEYDEDGCPICPNCHWILDGEDELIESPEGERGCVHCLP